MPGSGRILAHGVLHREWPFRKVAELFGNSATFLVLPWTGLIIFIGVAAAQSQLSTRRSLAESTGYPFSKRRLLQGCLRRDPPIPFEFHQGYSRRLREWS